MKPKAWLLLFCTLAPVASPEAAWAPGESSPPARTFLLTYQVTVKNLPAGAERVRVWIPRAVTDANQTVSLRKTKGPVPLRETRETTFGNHILYGEILHPQAGPAEFTLEYQVTRKEYAKGDYESLLKASHTPDAPPTNLAAFLSPDHLVPIDGGIKELADQETRGKQDTVEKARALYDYVFRQCATTSRARAGGAAMRSGCATRSMATARTSTRYLSP